MESSTTKPRARGSIGRWIARVLAVLAVAAAALALFLVITGTLEGGDDDKQGDKRAKKEQPEGQPAETYVVQSGDTLAGIAAKVSVPVERLEELNPQIDPQALQAGATLKLR